MEQQQQLRGWDRELTKQVKKWQQLLNDRALAHEEACHQYWRSNMLLTVPNVVCSTLLGSMGITDFTSVSESENSSPQEQQDMQMVHKYYTGILAITVAVLTALDSMLQWNVTAHSHRTSARSYSRLVTSIDTQLIHDQGHREEADMFIEKLVNSMENLRDHAPMLPTGVLRKFPRLMPTNNVRRTRILGGFISNNHNNNNNRNDNNRDNRDNRDNGNNSDHSGSSQAGSDNEQSAAEIELGRMSGGVVNLV